jgi:hypothetical protein
LSNLGRQALQDKVVSTEINPPVQRPSVVATVLLLIGAVGFMAVFFGLYSVLRVQPVVFGLLFLLYWAAILRQDRGAFFPSALGGQGGILLGWLLICMPTLAGRAGSLISLSALAVALFCFMRGHARLVVNNATMLFLTVSTIPELNVSKDVVGMVQSLLLGAAYMGVVTVAADFVKKRFSRRPVAPV